MDVNPSFSSGADRPDVEQTVRRKGSPAYLATRGTPETVDDLLDHVLIAHADRRIPWRMRTPSGAIRELATEPGTVIPEPAVTKTMLLGAAGIGWIPDFDARDALRSGALIRILPDHPADSIDVHGPISQSPKPVREGTRVYRRCCATIKMSTRDNQGENGFSGSG